MVLDGRCFSVCGMVCSPQDSLEEEFRVALTAAVPVEEKVGLILSEFQVFEVIKLINSTKSKVPCFLDPSCFF